MNIVSGISYLRRIWFPGGSSDKHPPRLYVSSLPQYSFILVFMPACLHIGKALIIEILVNDAASLAYKERSSRRCIGEGCLDDLLINFAAGAVW